MLIKLHTPAEVFASHECDLSCPHLQCWNERHPYGSTSVTETLCECDAEQVSDCPVLNAQDGEDNDD